MKQFLTIFLSLLLAVAAIAGDWAVTVGGSSARNGVSDEVGPTDDTTIWNSGPFGDFCRQGAAEDRVFTIARTFDRNDTLHGAYLYALDSYTGVELWHRDMPVDFPSTDYRIQLMGINGGRVYATRAGSTHASYLYAFDAYTGVEVWKSEDTVQLGGSDGLAYAPDGDLIVGNWDNIMRVNGGDGTTEWETARSSICSDSTGAAVFDGKAYTWEFNADSYPRIRVFDISDGSYLYESGQTTLGYTQQTIPFVGTDGTVYAPRTNSSTDSALVAFEDTGSALTEKWRFDLGNNTPFTTFASASDGSVYAHDRSNHIVRLDPDTGAILDTSGPVLATSDCYLRTAIDADGILYMTIGDWPDGMFYSFNPDLTLRWSENYPEIGSSGPILGRYGILIIAGDGTNIKAYYTGNPLGADEENSDSPNNPLGFTLHPAYPNPSNGTTTISFALPETADVELSVYDIKGRKVTTAAEGDYATGEYSTDVFGLSSGVYLYRLNAGDFADTRKMIVK